MTDSGYDIVVVGGGLVGLSLACALKGSGYNMLVLDAAPEPKILHDNLDEVSIENGELSLCLGPRVSSLNPHSVGILQRLQVWDLIPAVARCPFEGMRVWDGQGTGELDFDAALTGRDWMGQIVDNAQLVSALRHVAEGTDAISLQQPVALKDIQHSEEGICIELESGEIVHTNLIVGADGANSQIRELMNLPTRQWGYGQDALVTHVYTEKPHGGLARQCFTEQGPLAYLPMNLAEGHVSSIVWSATPVFIDHLRQLETEAVAALLADGLEGVLGKVEAVAGRFSFPLRQRHARHYVAKGVALIGDAAHTIHPLAGQGLNLGLADADCLAKILADARLQGESVGALNLLRQYQSARQRENLAMMAAMEGLKRLFGSGSADITLVRNLGLRWVQGSRLLKQQFMRLASGELL